jgi:nucleoside-diphosphate-sugar epimerase
MNILVTGKGFIGRSLFENLAQDYNYKNDNIICVHRSADIGTQPLLAVKNVGYWRANLANQDDVKILYHHYQPDIIFHCASTNSTKGGYAETITNLDITNNLLEYCPTKPRFVFMSSLTVYSNKSLSDGACESGETCPASFYGLSKLASEELIRLYYERGKLSSAYNLRLSAVVGRYATHGLLIDLIKKLKSDSEKLYLIGQSPGTCKCYVHINDVINFAKMIGNRPSGFNTFNICNYDLLTVKKIAKLTMSELNIKKEIVWSEDTWIGDNPLVCAFDDKAIALGWNKKYCTSEDSVKQAIKELI